ncbi:MAG: VCBS repeat-containing protein [Myxococcota bacterium]
MTRLLPTLIMVAGCSGMTSSGPDAPPLPDAAGAPDAAPPDASVSTTDASLPDGDAPGDFAVAVREVSDGRWTAGFLSQGTRWVLEGHVENRGQVELMIDAIDVAPPCEAGGRPNAPLPPGAAERFEIVVPASVPVGEHACEATLRAQAAGRSEEYRFEFAFRSGDAGTPAVPLDLLFSDQSSQLDGSCESGNPFGSTFVDFNNDGHIDVASWSHGGEYRHCARINDGSGRFVLNDAVHAQLRPGGVWGRSSATNWWVWDAYIDGDGLTDLLGYGSESPTGIALNVARRGQPFRSAPVHTRLAYTDVVPIDWDGTGELELVTEFLDLYSASTGAFVQNLSRVRANSGEGGSGRR